jgi:hypothetical protein
VVATVTVNPASPTKNIGDPAFQFTAVAKNAAGTICAVSFNWSSTNTAIAQINSSGIASVPFSGTATDYNSPGNTSTITATAIGSGVQGQTTLTVVNPVHHVTITSAAPPMLIVCGSPSSYQFAAEARDSSDVALSSQPPISWNSSVPAVATISNTGLATAVDGTSSPTSITATAYGKVSGAVSLDVSGGATITVSVTPATGTVPAGSTDAITASVGGSCTTCDVTWSVVDLAPPANGTVSPAGPGTATTYTAPFTVPAPSTVTVRAKSTENTNCIGTADITVLPPLASPAEFDLGGSQNPQALVIGQFDADTNLDIAVADQNSDDVSILLGDGAGSLALNGSVFSLGSDPVALAQGSFNGDAFPDLAVVDFGDDEIASLLGTGAGSFDPAVPVSVYSVGTSPQSVAAGDLDNDGNSDLVVANFFSDDITVLTSNGDGTFTTSQTIPLPADSGPWAVALGSIDGDGNPDLVVADLSDETIWVLLGNGDGTFPTSPPGITSITLPGNPGPGAVVIADFDGGDMDLAIVNRGHAGDTCPPPPANTADDTVTILIGHGDGLFSAPVSYAVGSNPRGVAVGDFNKDGFTDVVTANYCSDDVSLLFGNGDGTLQTAVNHFLGSNSRPTGIAVGDLDNDTFDDVAVSNSGGDSVSVLLNNN